MARNPTAVRIQTVGDTDVSMQIPPNAVDDDRYEGLFRPHSGTSSAGYAAEAFRDDDTAAKEYSPSSGRSLADPAPPDRGDRRGTEHTRSLVRFPGRTP
jgi:hypothetical protein